MAVRPDIVYLVFIHMHTECCCRCCYRFCSVCRDTAAAAAAVPCCCCSSSCAGWQNLLLVHYVRFQCFLSLHSNTKYFCCTPSQFCRIYGLDLPTASVITGMRGAKAGVSQSRRSRPCTMYRGTIPGTYEPICIPGIRYMIGTPLLVKPGIRITPCMVIRTRGRAKGVTEENKIHSL